MFQAAVDAAIWAFALWLATFLRYEFELNQDEYRGLFIAIPVVAAIQLGSGIATGIYLGRWKLGSFEEVAGLVRAAMLAAAFLIIIDVSTRWIPLSVAFIAPMAALVLMGGVRYAWRLLRERRRRPSGGELARVIVFGAGEGASQVITAMLRYPESRYLPVAILDDDPRRQLLRIRGVPVMGTRERLSDVALKVEADTLLIAVPSADAATVRELSELGLGANLRVKVLPPAHELFGNEVGVGDIRPLTEADLLGRREIDLDIGAIASYLAGKRVMVTGAGGSIGSELCRQLQRFGPAELVMIDRDESALHAVQLSIDGRALLDSSDLVVCDIRDRARLERVFAEHRPHVVFHAAALKHLPLLERHPCEALQTNVWGTQHLLDVAAVVGVERFVNISTDKAADPASVLGYSKRATERLTTHADSQHGGEYLSVRFGNVLGSRGSVLTTFRSQIAAGGPVTVTDPDVTRYFMTIEEAVQLVIQAGAIGRGGEVLVLDMGEPVKIAALARQLVDQAERPIDIVYTGLRKGEKLQEILLGRNEVQHGSVHPLINHVAVEPLDPAMIWMLDPALATGSLVTELEQLCASPPPNPDGLVIVLDAPPDGAPRAFAG